MSNANISGTPAWRTAFVAGAVALLIGTGCGSAQATSLAGKDAATKASTTAKPSAMTKAEAADPAAEICSKAIQTDVANQLGTGHLTKPPVMARRAGKTTCTYDISGGTLLMTVEELSTDAAATAHFARLRAQVSGVKRVPNLGADAFTRPDGTTFTVKDAKVLTIDSSHLPAGNDNTQIAQSLSFEILTCWSE